MIAAQPSRPVPDARPSQATDPARRTRRRARTSAVSSRSLQRAGTAVAAAATLLLTAYIGEYASVARASQKRSELRTELYRARQENSNLQARVQILERPARIDHVARAMGMEQRNDADYVALAPLPKAPAEKPVERPILAGFLPEAVSRWLHENR